MPASMVTVWRSFKYHIFAVEHRTVTAYTDIVP